ncbi:MAG: asparagine--tRNA ligase [Myxococcales bacterium]|nr:asparagine--tRNA ligase [Myxococcales bacterium]
MITTVAEISRRRTPTDDTVVTLQGWIYNVAGKGKLLFLQLRDGSGIIQCVCNKATLGDELFDVIKALGQESSLEIDGLLVADTRSKLGFEVQVTGARIVGPSDGYPITPKDHGDAFLFDHRHLWFRSKGPHAILHVRHLVVQAIRNYFDERGFLLLDSPIFTPNACEGTSTLFETEYFGRTAYLSQSGQLYQEAGATAFGKTYCFGPTFRAEKSDTRRHLNEFWMVEPEIAFIDLEGIMDMCEDFIVEVVAHVLKHGRHHLEALGRDIAVLERVQKPFPRMSYDEATAMIAALAAAKGDPEFTAVEPEDDFGSRHETELTQQFDRPIMVHRYPTAVKAFYMKADPARPERALGVDVLASEGYGEIIGGGQREDSYDELVRKINHHGLPMEAFEWYLDLRRYGTVPHGGMGAGLERLVTWICDVKNVRQSVPFPRTVTRLTP